MRIWVILCVMALGCRASSSASGPPGTGTAGTGSAGGTGTAGTGSAGSTGTAGTAADVGCYDRGPSAVRPADEPISPGEISFLAPSAYGTATISHSIAVGDVDGDGSLDVAVGTFPGAASPACPTPRPDGGCVQPSNRVSALLLNDGKGAFRPSEMDPVPGGLGAIRLADVTGDGKPDLVAYLTNGGPASLVIVANEGGGQFGPRRQFGAGEGTDLFWSQSSMAVGDLDGDGLSDVAVLGKDGVNVLLNDGSGAFAAPVKVATPAYPTAVVIADLDGDRRGELFLTAAQALEVFAIDAGGASHVRATVDVGREPNALASGDLDRDGDVDLVVTSTGNGKWAVGVLLNRGDGTLGAPSGSYLGDGYCGATAVAIADFDADGVPDLAATHDTFGNVYFFLGVGDGTFRRSERSLARETSILAAADLNGDHRADLIVAGQREGANVRDLLKVFLSRTP